MTKRLLLLRHAKALPGERGIRDRDRPLAPRGHRDAELMAPLVAAESPDLILCSPARRTRETLAGLANGDAATDNTIFVGDLYDATGNYLDIIAAYGGDAACVLVIGHNPTIQATALALAASGERALIGAVTEKYPTAGFAVLELDISSWRNLASASGRLTAFRTPREMGGGGED